MKLKKKEIIGIVLLCVLMLGGMYYVHTMEKKIDRPGVSCPECGSPETLVTERCDDGSVRCLCYDCKTRFIIRDSADDDTIYGNDSIDDDFDPGCYDPAYDGPLPDDSVDAEEQQLLNDEEDAYATLRPGNIP